MQTVEISAINKTKSSFLNDSVLVKTKDTGENKLDNSEIKVSLMDSDKIKEDNRDSNAIFNHLDRNEDLDEDEQRQ